MDKMSIGKNYHKIICLTLISFYFKILQLASSRCSISTEGKNIIPSLLVKKGPTQTFHCKNITTELKSIENVAFVDILKTLVKS